MPKSHRVVVIADSDVPVEENNGNSTETFTEILMFSIKIPLLYRYISFLHKNISKVTGIVNVIPFYLQVKRQSK